MIDEKKIEEAARKQFSNIPNTKANACMRVGFMAGACWSLQEFKKSLWHDASEEPENNSQVLVQYRIDKAFNVFHWTKYNLVSPNLRNFWTLDITRWLYCKDLLPKEGGEE